jgi:hypothetical protein
MEGHDHVLLIKKRVVIVTFRLLALEERDLRELGLSLGHTKM